MNVFDFCKRHGYVSSIKKRKNHVLVKIPGNIFLDIPKKKIYYTFDSKSSSVIKVKNGYKIAYKCSPKISRLIIKGDLAYEMVDSSIPEGLWEIKINGKKTDSINVDQFNSIGDAEVERKIFETDMFLLNSKDVMVAIEKAKIEKIENEYIEYLSILEHGITDEKKENTLG